MSLLSWAAVRVESAGLNERETDWFGVKKMSSQAVSLYLEEGVRDKSPCFPGDGNFLAEGTFKGREFCSIV